MRAIEGSRHARPWRKLTGVTVASVLALSVFSGSASAAPPNWSMDPVVLLPDTVSPGGAAGYLVTINNAGPSNISQLYLIAYLGDTTTPAPDPVYTSPTKGSCPNTNDTLYCSLGQLRSGKSVSVTVAFPTPTEGPEFSIRFEANTTGATSSDGGASHGDTIVATGTTTLTSDPDFAGRFVIAGLQDVFNNQALGSGNLQTTRVGAPAVAIGVTVKDGTLASDDGWCLICTSESSEVNVNNGATFSNGFKIEIQVSKDLVNGSISTVYHQLDDGETVEAITTACPKNGNPNAAQMPCFRTKNLPGGNTLVTIWTTVNGKYGM